MRCLARLETSSCVPEMAEENKILEEVTWLVGLLGAHDIFGEEILNKSKECRSQASAHQLRKQKAVRLGAGVEACRRGLSATAIEGFQSLAPDAVTDIRNSLIHCEVLRVTDVAKAKLVKDAAALCLRSVEDASLAADAAAAALDVIEVPSEASDDHQRFLVLKLATIAAKCGSKICALLVETETQATAIIEKPNCSAIDKLLEYHRALQRHMSAFQEARAKVEPHCSEGPMETMIRGWPVWLQGVSDAETLLNRLVMTAVGEAGKQLNEKISSLVAGGKPAGEGGSWKVGLAPDASWSDIAREMEGCFWSKPGVLRTLDKGCEALRDALQRYKQTCDSAGIKPDKQLTQLAEERKSLALLTLTEEYMASKIVSPDGKTKSKLNKRKLDITDKFEYTDVHATIRAEVARLTSSRVGLQVARTAAREFSYTKLHEQRAWGAQREL